VRARLTTPAGSAIAGVTLTFTLGQGTCIATTDSDGFASCNIAFSASAAVPATYTVSFAGTSAYAQNSSDGPVVPSALS
jgi:hypothetical protein